MLQAMLPQVCRDGAIATAGVAAGNDLATTMFPFVLRGVALLGLVSSYCQARHAGSSLAADIEQP